LKRLVPLLLFLGGCCLLTLAVAVFGAVVFMQSGAPSGALTWQAPLEQVDQRALAPETVLLPLTGVDSADALSAALDQAHLENVYALIAYDPNLSDATRVGALLQLGAQYAVAQNTRKAASSYQSAARLATLSPALSDPARMDTYQQASVGLRGIGATDAARGVTDQAYLVAQSSPALQRDARARRLDQVAEAYAALGANALAAQARAKSVKVASATTEGAGAPVRVPFAPPLGKLPPATEVDPAKQRRIATAQQLLDDLTSTPPGAGAWPADFVAQLSDALLAEDSARQAYYDKHIAQAADPAVRAALMRDKVNWLALKYRVARGAFGKTLIVEWSADAKAIGEAWSSAWDDWFRMSTALAAQDPKPQSADQATEDVVRQELIAAQWGWYTNATEQDLREALDNATQKLMQASTPALRLDALTRSGKTMYLLVPDELYGQGERALPK